jgi:hypothetical protein
VKREPKPSRKVTELLAIGWTPAAGGLVALSEFIIRRRPTEGISHFIDVFAGERHVQVYVSPSGRSVRVYVDGTEA